MLLITLALPVAAQRYTARQVTTNGVPIVQLADQQRNTIVSIAPSVGNNAYEMNVNGKNVFYFPFNSVAEFAAKPRLCGIPFLAPWANRIDQAGFYANGKYHKFDLELGNLGLDGNGQPIHGLLQYAQWEVVAVEADANETRSVSRLNFGKQEKLLAQFPFPHTIEMTHILRDGNLEVKTRITNDGSEAMPVGIGFHPYFQILDAPREHWKVRIDAASQWLLSEKLVPSGEKQPIREMFADPRNIELGEILLDHVFGDLVRDETGGAHFTVKGERQTIDVVYGPNYKASVIYAPRQPYICFEPMSGITNAFNLAQRGVYKDLQTIAPGGEWEASFQVRPSGF
jgi:aldose 1-epimerase